VVGLLERDAHSISLNAFGLRVLHPAASPCAVTLRCVTLRSRVTLKRQVHWDLPLPRRRLSRRRLSPSVERGFLKGGTPSRGHLVRAHAWLLHGCCMKHLHVCLHIHHLMYMYVHVYLHT
jgi:hypothetical protein